MLNRLDTAFILWSWPLARILFCSIILLVSPPSVSLALSDPVQFHSFAWLSWTTVSTLLTVSGQLQRTKALCTLIVGDMVMIIIAITLLRGTEEATIAFAVCVGVIAIIVGVKSRNLLAAVAAGACMFLFRDFIMPPPDSPLHFISSVSTLSRALFYVIFLLAMFMVVTSASRKYRLRLFNNEFASLRILALDQSFQFDLQSWINASAALFKPNKAACIVQGPTPQGSIQYHACNLPMLQKEQVRQELLDALGRLEIGYRLFDTYLNRVISPDTGDYRAFDENEQRIAYILRSADIREALVQPLQIDRMRGGFICAVNSRMDAVIMAEASFLGCHVTEVTAYLSKVANAQRNFIADAYEVARRDLHDGVLQTLAALRMRLLLLTKREDVARKPIELEIRKAVDIVTLEQSRLRGFLESNDIAVHTVELVAQLDICARTISLQWGVDVTLKSEEPAIPVDVESSFNIEHLLREVITNAVRHAKSKRLTVSLSLKQNALIITVFDLSDPLEGTEMRAEATLNLKSASLRERLRLLNGEAYVEGLGKGTLISIRIPMQQIEND